MARYLSLLCFHLPLLNNLSAGYWCKMLNAVSLPWPCIACRLRGSDMWIQTPPRRTGSGSWVKYCVGESVTVLTCCKVHSLISCWYCCPKRQRLGGVRTGQNWCPFLSCARKATLTTYPWIRAAGPPLCVLKVDHRLLTLHLLELFWVGESCSTIWGKYAECSTIVQDLKGSGVRGADTSHKHMPHPYFRNKMLRPRRDSVAERRTITCL